ncbi:hypothetical protein ABZT28_56305, partial [Streptomyces sp. NPDC005388]|uniref:hypothetical protein n=1 Tax=Streptomyces sp. NPDC005388 TaxID=3156717 RepID=UPI0033AE482B
VVAAVDGALMNQLRAGRARSLIRSRETRQFGDAPIRAYAGLYCFEDERPPGGGVQALQLGGDARAFHAGFQKEPLAR